MSRGQKRSSLRMIRIAGMLGSACVALTASTASAEPKRPNVVLILADDLGFSDVAPYGSEIATPTITTLAEHGVRFTNYHTAASCAPSRAMLLTGVDSHRAGVPNIPEMLPAEQKQHPHYQGSLGRNVVTVATLLQESGYHTYIAGKWHLGMTPDLLPINRGFERTYVLADSGADNWEQKSYLPIYDKANWFADGEEVELPEGAGMVAMSTTDDWLPLAPEQTRYQAKRMAVYAAMVEAMDFQRGRLVAHLKEIGEYENTIFIFTSDNGSEAAGPENPESSVVRFGLGRQGYSTDYETLGLKGSFNSIGPSFASAAASPLAYYKFYLGEGGLRVPLIISGEPLPSDDRAGRIEHAFTWVTDIAPTILELADTAKPRERYGGRVVEPMVGRSLGPAHPRPTGNPCRDPVGADLAPFLSLSSG